MTAESAPSLRELLGYPPLAAAVSLTGDADLDRRVTGVTLVDPAGTGPVRAGEIALCAAVPAGYLSDWRVDATIRRLHDQRAAAFAVPLPRAGEEPLLDGSRRLARHLGLPVLGVGTDPLRWAGEATAFLHASSVAAAELLRRAHRALTGAPLGPPEVARALARLIDRPVAVFGPDGAPITESFGPPPGFDPYRAVAQTLVVDGETTVAVPVPATTGAAVDL